MEKIKSTRFYNFLDCNNDFILRIIYLVHLFVSFNTLLNIYFISRLTLILLSIITAISLFLKVISINTWKKDFKSYIVIFFIISYLLSMIFVVNQNFIDNLKCILWMVIQLFLIYLYLPGKNKSIILKDFKILSFLSMVYFNIINLIAFFLMYNNIHVFRESLDGSIQFYGYWWGRLYGFFNDPNHAAVISVIIILIAVGFFSLYKLAIIRLFCIFTICIQFVFLYLTDSRTGIVSLLIGLFLYFIFYQMFTFKNRIKLFRSFCLFLLTIFISLGLGVYIRSANNSYFLSIQETSTVNEGLEKEEYSNPTNHSLSLKNIEKNEKSEINTSRSDDLSRDISNRRFDIWESGLELFSLSPLLGVGGYANIVSFAEKNFPSTYIVSNDYKVFNSFHNSFLDILVSQGIIGIVLFFILMIYNIIFLFRNIQSLKIDSEISSILLSIIGAVLVSSLLISNIMYINSIESYFFWLSLGYLNYLITTNKSI